MNKYLSLARKLDPQYPTNKVVLLLMPVLFMAGAVYGYFTKETIPDVLLSGVYLTFTFFFAWAIAREIDPDNAYSAFVAAAIAVAAWWLGHSAALFVNFFFLMILRLAIRSTGRKMLLADWFVLFILAIWATILGKFYALPLLALVSFADYFFKPRNKGALIPALDAVVLAAFAIYYFTLPGFKVTPMLLWLFGAAAAVVIFLVLTTRKVDAVGDLTGEPLLLLRVRLALWVCLLVMCAEIFFYGLPGFWDIAPLAAALAGVAIYRPLVWLKSL